MGKSALRKVGKSSAVPGPTPTKYQKDQGLHSSNRTVTVIISHVPIMWVFFLHSNIIWYLRCLMTKPTKWNVRPAKTQISLGIHAVWSVFAVHMKEAWVLSYPLSAQQRLWSDWADLSLRWAHSHFVGFVMRRLIFLHRNSYKIQVSKLFGMKLLITDEMEWITNSNIFCTKITALYTYFSTVISNVKF